MSYITESFLRNQSVLQESFSAEAMMNKVAGRTKHFFLSHSHQDSTLALGLKKYLANLNINLYIDWLDTTMPQKTNKETAQRIKLEITASDQILVLATQNAVKSRWVPWEVGIADNAKTSDKITVIPVADDNGNFSGNEYLELYRRVVITTKGNWGVFEPNETNGWTIDGWLNQL